MRARYHLFFEEYAPDANTARDSAFVQIPEIAQSAYRTEHCSRAGDAYCSNTG